MSAVWIPVLASMKGFVSEVNRGAAQAGKAAGSSIKKDLEDAGQQGGKSAADAMAQQFQVASQKVAAARKKEAGAASDLAVAEEQLNQVRSQGDATAGQIMAAEAKVDDARRRQETAASRLGAAEQDLQAVRDGGESRVTSVVSAEQALEDARLKAQAAADKVAVAEQQAQDARESSVSAVDQVAAAETKLIDTRDRYGAGSKQTNAAERELAKARREADRASVAAEKAEGGVGRARADAKTATESAEGAELKLKAAKEKAAQSAQKAGNEAQTAGAKVRGMGADMAGAEPKTSSLGGSLMGLAGKAAGMGLAFAGVNGITGMLSGGFDRLMGIQKAEILFQNIGLTADETGAQMDQLSEQVTGTAVSLADAASVSAAMAQAGVELGGEMNGAIDAFTALSAAAMGSNVDITNIMKTVAAQGKVTMSEINSLSSGGVNATKWLADSMGKSMEEVTESISAGEVSFEDFVTAVNEGAGDLAQSMGETLPARLSNAKTAFSNLAAGVIEPFIEPITNAVIWLTDQVKAITPVVKEALGSFMEGIGTIKEYQGVIMGVAGAVGSLAAGMAVYNTVTKIQKALNAAQMFLAMERGAKRAALAQKGLNVAMWTSPITWIAAAVIALGAALVYFFTKTETGKKAWSAFTDFLGAAWEKIKGFFSAAWDVIEPVWDGIVDGAKRVWETINPVFEWIGQAWQNLVGWFQDGGFESALGRIGEVFELAFTPVRWLIDQLREAWTWATEAIAEKYEQNVVPMLDAFKEKWQQAKDIIAPFIDTIKEKWEIFSTAVKEFYDAHIAPAIDAFKDKFGELIGKVKEFVADYWEPLLKPALMVLAALILGPVVIAFMAVITAVGLVIGIIMGLIYVVVSLPGWVKGAVEGVKQWFADMWTNVKQWFSDMGESISNWWNDHVAPLPGKVSGAVEEIKNWFSDMWQSIKNWFSDMCQAVSDWWNNYVAPLPGQVGQAVEGVLNWFRNLPDQIKQLFSDAGQWLVSAGKRILNGLWEGMKSAWTSVKNWLSDTLSFSSIGSLIGLSGGGIVVMADGGITQYVNGGIDQLEQYANGGSRENHVAQIAPAGAWRVWAEDETGGEAYIPLHPSKRGRSTAILDEVAGRFGYDLVDSSTGQPYGGGYSGDLGPQHVAAFADGAVVTSDDFTRFVHGDSINGEKASGSLEGWPYNNYPSDPGAWGDCSYTVGKVSALAVGKRTAGRHFATGTEASVLSSWGFTRGRGTEGDLLIGFRNGGPGGGHTSGTLPDGTNFEMGGARGNGQIGGGAAGAWDSYYTDFFHMPVGPTFENVELDGMGEFGDFADPYGAGYSPVSEAEAITADAAGTSDEPTTISGMFGKVAQEAVSGQVADFLSVIGAPDELPSWATGAREAHAAYTTPRTSVAEEHAEANQDAAVTSMTADQINADPQLSGMDSMDVTSQPEVPEWGPEFFAYEISRQAKSMDLSADGAKIGIATALVESGDPMKMYANNAVPESLNYRHDAVGSDHDSVGLFQQRDNGAWGTVAERMDPFKSARMFFAELVKFDWESMDPGAAAQKVQRSAFPDRYGQKMTRAEELVASTGLYSPVAEAEAITAESALAEDTALYDQGGILDHEKLALNLSGKPEAVLTNDQWQMLSGLGDNLPDMVGSTVSAGVSGAIGAGAGSAAGMANMVVPGAGAAISGLAGPAAQLGGWYAGEVASGWTSSILQAGQQAFSAVTEPLEDIAGRFTAPAPVVNGPAPTLGTIPERRENDDKGGRPSGESIVINVNSVEEAIELKKHLEARQLLGLGKR